MRRDEVTKSQRWLIADALANDRLEEVNKICKPVRAKKSFYSKYGKRAIDILLSIAALGITLPINLLLAIGTLLDVGRPIFFKQTRVGMNGKPFTLIKFRNMREAYDEKGDPLPAKERVTKFGKFVRGTSLDELLNFVCILKGDMSIIGPRPLVPEYTHRYNSRHLMRLAVRPGLECPPPCDHKGEWTWNDQFENDVWYVENISLLTDLRMVGRLVHFALNRKAASNRVTAERGSFMGYDFNGRAINMEDVPQSYIDALED